MSRTEEHHVQERELADLQNDFPGYRIWQESMGDRVRLVAVRRGPGVTPHTLVTADPAELRAALADSADLAPVRTSSRTKAGEGHA
jgi:hypothetical protein